MKRFEGRDEPILDPDLPIVDAHHHLFDRPALRYLLDDYLDDARAGHRIVASVYVETQAMMRRSGPEHLRPLGEVEFANGVGAIADSGTYGECRVCAGIVGYVDLTMGDAIAEYLDRALSIAPDRMRGVRQVTIEDPSGAYFRHMTMPRPAEGIMKHPGFRKGFRHLAPRALTFDVAVIHTQLPEVAQLADAFPDTTLVLNLMGIPNGVDQDATGLAAIFRDWRGRLRELARRPNVVCKVGGLGMVQWGLGFDKRPEPVGYLELAEAWRPYVETAIEAFGSPRCMAVSNFPPDGRSCGFVPLWNALKHIVAGSSAADKAALFHGTAARVYRVDALTAPGIGRMAHTGRTA